MPIVKVFFGMSVRRAEEEQPQAVAEVERSGLETENSEDVHVGKRRTTRRQVAGGKSRLRRRFGGRQVRLEEPKESKESKESKAERKFLKKELMLAKKLSRAEAQKAKKDAKEIQNKGEASEIVAGKRERSASRRSSSGRSKSDESRKGKRSVSFRRSKSEGRKFLKPKMTKEEKLAKKLARKEANSKKRERAGSSSERSRSKSTESRKEKGNQSVKMGKKVRLSNSKMSDEEKQAKKLARQEAKETAKTFKTAPETSEERPEIPDFTLAPMTKALAIKLRRDERKLKRQAVKKALKDPNRIRLGTFQYGKLVNVPAAFRDMRKRAGRR
ncbi:hypothetical protein L5515_012892 [Caenorhabditis briggsae]|uniref:Uncharacterized protein n=1 Tax=Caenorhabditis briggsae TaxID=6238 RepID=A0AAE9JJR7_CAEBR|nr:hypothetical protein L5515_012892 [Caenorhabditis briggsae]